ncbi:MAG: hypothetical protein M1834_005165 [Cirrosporium novae-zelandiae]|nr:MAG: hypothetical protein M1834_005165 [Cirrosporium novae-zelandiae]
MSTQSVQPVGFKFSIREIREDESARPHKNQFSPDGPPKMGDSRVITNSETFYHWKSEENGVQVTSVASPSNSEHCYVCSVYYNAGLIFVLPHDATSRPSDDITYDWQPLSFSHMANGYAYVGYAREYQHVNITSPAPAWANELLVDAHKRLTNNQSEATRQLVGEVPVILALIALSVPQDQTIVAALTGYSGQNKRGVIVRAWPDSSTVWKNFENGTYGPVLR